MLSGLTDNTTGGDTSGGPPGGVPGLAHAKILPAHTATAHAVRIAADCITFVRIADVRISRTRSRNTVTVM
jgi:hypothetical protein